MIKETGSGMPERISMPVRPELLQEVVKRIVQAANPRRIILFGSCARNAMGPHSDLDLLVVMPDGTHRRHTAIDIFKALRGIGVPKDVVVVTEADIEKYGQNPSLVLKPALDEGIDLYVAA